MQLQFDDIPALRQAYGALLNAAARVSTLEDQLELDRTAQELGDDGWKDFLIGLITNEIPEGIKDVIDADEFGVAIDFAEDLRKMRKEKKVKEADFQQKIKRYKLGALALGSWMGGLAGIIVGGMVGSWPEIIGAEIGGVIVGASSTRRLASYLASIPNYNKNTNVEWERRRVAYQVLKNLRMQNALQSWNTIAWKNKGQLIRFFERKTSCGRYAGMTYFVPDEDGYKLVAQGDYRADKVFCRALNPDFSYLAVSCRKFPELNDAHDIYIGFSTDDFLKNLRQAHWTGKCLYRGYRDFDLKMVRHDRMSNSSFH